MIWCVHLIAMTKDSNDKKLNFIFSLTVVYCCNLAVFVKRHNTLQTRNPK